MSASDTGRKAPQRTPPRPDRVRRIDRGFAFIPNRFLHDGFFASLGQVERSLYLFLVLAGDRNGVSFYGYDRICATLEVSPDDYVLARNGLIDKDLVAFDGTRFQVLSLPRDPAGTHRPPLVTADDFENHDPATVRRIIESSLGQRR
jgi:hypothetical protein